MFKPKKKKSKRSPIWFHAKSHGDSSVLTPLNLNNIFDHNLKICIKLLYTSTYT